MDDEPRDAAERIVATRRSVNRLGKQLAHLPKAPIGALFNKTASQMELQPSSDGKLALSLPPIPFEYTLQNGPIPLYSVDEPDGQPLRDVTLAHHRATDGAQVASNQAWPWHVIDMKRIDAMRTDLGPD